MRKFISENIKWLNKYFQDNKCLFEILALFFVAETFFYSTVQFDFDTTMLSALKVIFWILLFLVTFLLYIKTEMEYSQKDDSIMTSLFQGAILSKYLIRVILLTFFFIIIKLLYYQIKLNWDNPHLFILWFSMILLIFFEFERILILKIKKNVEK